ncbi:DNA polymerase I, partial [Pseudomonas syringae]
PDGGSAGTAAPGVELQGVRIVPLLEACERDPTATRHDRDRLVAQYLTHTPINSQESAGKGAKQLSFDQIALQQAGNYAAEEADLTLRLHVVFHARLAAILTLHPVLNELEIPLVHVLVRI